MIRGVLYLGAAADVAGEAVARLQRGGLHAAACTDATGAAAVVEGWGVHAGGVLALAPAGQQVPGGMLAWQDVAQTLAQQLPPGELPSCDAVMQAVVQHNRTLILAGQQRVQQQQEQPLLVVGYVMKSSRERQLAEAGLLHLLPADGVCFMPFDVGQLQQHEQESQQQQQRPRQGHIDVLLHKGSDELVATPDGHVAWSPRLLALQAWLAHQPHVAIVDPFEHTAKVLDRAVLGRLLQDLPDGLALPPGVTVRAPRWCIVTERFDDVRLPAALADAGLWPPFIVKPLVACGVPHSHSMALLMRADGLARLAGRLPLPAVVQEFVNHGGLQHKVYVLGDEVFVTPRSSIPDVQPDASLAPEQQLLLFDSLASLPTQLPVHMACGGSGSADAEQQQQQQAQLDMAAVRAVAARLQERLGLTLFGFDVVVAAQPWQQAQTPGAQQQQQQHHGQQQHGQQQQEAVQQVVQQELVLVDVNYFPNYRGGGSAAPALFRRALRRCWQRHTQQQRQQQEGV